MQAYEFGKTPIDIVDMQVVEIQKSEISDEEKKQFVIKTYRGSNIDKGVVEFSVEEGFKTSKGEFVMKRTDNSLVIRQNGIFSSLPFPEGLALNEINLAGYYNGQICMLGKKNGKCFVMNGYNKPVVDTEIKYTSFK